MASGADSAFLGLVAWPCIVRRPDVWGAPSFLRGAAFYHIGMMRKML